MKQDFDELAKNYDAELKTSLGIFAGNNIDKFARYKIDALALFCKSPQSILEFGCGTGRNLPFLRQKFPNAQIFASDISEKSLEIAKNDNPSVIFAKIDSPKELADAHKDIELVFVSGVFHHIPFEEHKNYFEALNKILAQNGKIVIFEHNPHNPLTSRIFKNSKIDLGCKMLSPKYLKKTLERANFGKINIYFTLFFLWRNAFFCFLEKFLFCCPFGGQYFIIGGKN